MTELEAEVKRAVQDRDNTLSSWKLALKRAEVQQEAYKLNVKKYDQGMISSIEYQSAVNNWLQAQADRLQAQLTVPIIHMIRETVGAIAAAGRRTVGILATDGTIQTGIYQKELEAAGLTAVTPPADLQKVVMSIIYDEIKRGETGSREKFGEIDSFLRQAGCDCAILGCTELSVYRTLHGLPPYYIDAMEILAEQSILRCGKRLRNV